MKALIFAAGRGERMRPLTDRRPKPLLDAGGKPLIVWHLERLAAAGVNEVCINISHLADCFAPALGDGARWGLTLRLIDEGEVPLETGGGMLNALPFLGDQPFLVINGDIWTDFEFRRLALGSTDLARLVMVDNPDHHPRGDFALGEDGRLAPDGETRLTYAGIGLYRSALLEGWRSLIGDSADASRSPPRFKLAPLLSRAIDQGRVSALHHHGGWTDVGTPERLQAIDRTLRGTTVAR